MQNFHFHGRKEKGAHTPFTAPYFAFVRLGRVFYSVIRLFGVQDVFCGCFGRERVCRLISFSAVIYTQWV